jgi:hypothetical protein
MEHPSRPTLVGHCLLFPNGVTIVVVVVVIASVSHYLYVIVESAISVIRQRVQKASTIDGGARLGDRCWWGSSAGENAVTRQNTTVWYQAVGTT